MISLAKMLRTSKMKLQSLTIFNNNIGDEGALYLADALKETSIFNTLTFK